MFLVCFFSVFLIKIHILFILTRSCDLASCPGIRSSACFIVLVRCSLEFSNWVIELLNFIFASAWVLFHLSSSLLNFGIELLSWYLILFKFVKWNLNMWTSYASSRPHMIRSSLVRTQNVQTRLGRNVVYDLGRIKSGWHRLAGTQDMNLGLVLEFVGVVLGGG